MAWHLTGLSFLIRNLADAGCKLLVCVCCAESRFYNVSQRKLLIESPMLPHITLTRPIFDDQITALRARCQLTLGTNPGPYGEAEQIGRAHV